MDVRSLEETTDPLLHFLSTQAAPSMGTEASYQGYDVTGVWGEGGRQGQSHTHMTLLWVPLPASPNPCQTGMPRPSHNYGLSVASVMCGFGGGITFSK